MVAAVYIPRVTLGLGHTLPESRIALRAANFLKCQNKTANEYIVSLAVLANLQEKYIPREV